MKKKILSLTLVIALVAIAAISATLAYFTDTDAAHNTMVVGNIDIAQLEYERVVDENGNWIPDGTTDKYGYQPNTLKPFTQDKPLFPAYKENGDEFDENRQSWGAVVGEEVTGAPGALALMGASMNNVIDKFVFVENKGNNDAYVRTIVAFEQGDIAAEDFEKVIKTNSDYKSSSNPGGHWEREDVASNVTIGDSTYFVRCYTYVGASTNPNGVLAAGTISYPSLAQVYMMPEVTQEQAAAVDGNKNGKYDILVLSQAVQAQGFANIDEAFNAAFPGVDDPTVLAGWLANVAA